MQKFTTKIVDMMKSEGLFEWQGGPIILSQIENEFEPLEWDQGNPAKAYASWAANMAVALNTGVPWIMCKEDDAPDPILCAVLLLFNTEYVYCGREGWRAAIRLSGGSSGGRRVRGASEAGSMSDGEVFGFFIGISFPSVNITKRRVAVWRHAKIRFYCVQSKATEPYLRLVGMNREDMLRHVLFIEGPEAYYEGLTG
ncbi:hypothetical protein E2562_015710 [Oryza meyeriana var. granulata]|uniref:beta-galactosidase n=1 Tax=Oryza meyeriana var. granulata TaxID=110450 RepID=A0A6G1D445_9ORYZ|nr:hypothetical protein E2562_015710 [Oryza meyeriana var. granulata]